MSSKFDFNIGNIYFTYLLRCIFKYIIKILKAKKTN